MAEEENNEEKQPEAFMDEIPIEDLESPATKKKKGVSRSKSILERKQTLAEAEANKIKQAQAQQKTMEQLNKQKKKILLRRQKAKELAKKRRGYFTKEDMVSKIKKFEIRDKNDESNKKFIADERFQGPELNRKATNKRWIVVFAVLNIIFVIVVIYTLIKGAPKRLINGLDFRAEVCGHGRYGPDNINTKQYLYFIYPEKDSRVAMCVTACPAINGPQICLYKQDGTSLTNICYEQFQTEYDGRYCLPIEPNNRRIVDEELGKWKNLIKVIASDIYVTLDIIYISAILSLILATVVYYKINSITWIKGILYTSMICIILSFITMAILCYKEYLSTLDKRCRYKSNTDICGGWKAKAYFYAMIIFIVVLFIYCIVLFMKRDKIKHMVQILIAANKSTIVLKQLRMIPFYTLIAAILINSIFIVSFFQAFSVGSIETITVNNNAIFGNQIREFQYSTLIRVMVGFEFFMYIYWILIIFGVQDLLIALCFSIWYFQKRKNTVDIPIQRVYNEVFKFHLGTVFLVSITSAILSPIKNLLAVLRKQLGKAKQFSNVIRFIQAICISCLIIYEKFLRFLSKSAFTQVAMWSDEFYTASKKAFFLKFRHESIIKDMDSLQSFYNVQIRIMCGFIPASLSYLFLIFVGYSPLGFKKIEFLDTPFTPFVVCFIFGYVLATVYISTFDITMKTLIQLYLMDSEMFVGERRYAEEFIRELMDYYEKMSDVHQVGFKLHGKQQAKRVNGEALGEDEDESQQEQSESGSDDEYSETESDSDGSGSSESFGSSSLLESDSAGEILESESENAENGNESESGEGSGQGSDGESGGGSVETEELSEGEEEVEEKEDSEQDEESPGHSPGESDQEGEGSVSDDAEEEDLSEYDEDGKKVRGTRKGRNQKKDNVDVLDADLDQFDLEKN